TYNSTYKTDGIPPTITSINPTNGTTIPVNQTFTVTFNEQIKAGTNFNNIILWNNDLNILKPSTITINNNQLIITPTTKLMNAKYYSLIIPANSITDLAGNNLQNTYNSTYKTDGIPPIVTGINPLNNTKTHNTNQVITVFFKEPIKAGDAYNSITVKNYVGIDKDVNITIDTDQIIIIPLENYAPDMYILTIPVKAITDMAGNNLQNTVNVTFTVLI
ncbi:Ig-like domain-containing protein, partial [Methanobacterium sp. MZD130B]|uniref:Ig-like domain-containing protein n=1 Tax=Methanobacterium sp. MZD130B TaxID=3394378 RepID=UPI0039FB9ACC